MHVPEHMHSDHLRVYACLKRIADVLSRQRASKIYYMFVESTGKFAYAEMILYVLFDLTCFSRTMKK